MFVNIHLMAVKVKFVDFLDLLSIREPSQHSACGGSFYGIIGYYGCWS